MQAQHPAAEEEPDFRYKEKYSRIMCTREVFIFHMYSEYLYVLKSNDCVMSTQTEGMECLQGTM